jgi:hypothetical protein
MEVDAQAPSHSNSPVQDNANAPESLTNGQGESSSSANVNHRQDSPPRSPKRLKLLNSYVEVPESMFTTKPQFLATLASLHTPTKQLIFFKRIDGTDNNMDSENNPRHDDENNNNNMHDGYNSDSSYGSDIDQIAFQHDDNASPSEFSDISFSPPLAGIEITESDTAQPISNAASHSTNIDTGNIDETWMSNFLKLKEVKERTGSAWVRKRDGPLGKWSVK